MSTLTGRVRRRLLSPPVSQTTFAVRGFTGEPAARARLERVGAQFLVGLEAGLSAGSVSEVAHTLAGIDRVHRGFGYEGASMGLAVADALSPYPRQLVRDFVAGPAAAHVYMVHVGIGWAMARLPRPLWRRVLLPDPLLRWLALDGYGFHQAYFHTDRYVHRHRPIRVRPPWSDPSGYAARAADQGVGRALWFVAGADVQRLGNEVTRFAPARHADLWSGVGLAATYAGGADPDRLQTLRTLAGDHRHGLAQGAAFAAQARLRAGLVTPEVEAATAALCGTDVERAAAVTDAALVALPTDAAEQPAYEAWRQRIAGRLRDPAQYR